MMNKCFPGGTVDCPDSDGNTPLHTALSRCRQEAASVAEPTDMDNAKATSEVKTKNLFFWFLDG